MSVTAAPTNYLNFRLRYIDISESGNAEYTELGANDPYQGYVSYEGTNTFDFIIKSINYSFGWSIFYAKRIFYTIPEMEGEYYILYVSYLGEKIYHYNPPNQRSACVVGVWHTSLTVATEVLRLIWGYYTGGDPITYKEDLNNVYKYKGYGDQKLHKFKSLDGKNWTEVVIPPGDDKHEDSKSLVWSFDNYKNYVESENNKDYKVVKDDKEIQAKVIEYEGDTIGYFPLPYLINKDKVFSGTIVHYDFLLDEEV